MALTTVILISFLALTLVVAGVTLLVRDVYAHRRQRIEARAGIGASRRILESTRFEEEPAPLRGVTQRIDRWFTRLMFETGLPLSPESAILLMALIGFAVGAAMFIWLDNAPAALVVTPLAMLPLLGYFLYLRSRRFKQMYEQLPGMLDLLSRAVRAGESTDEAFQLAGATGQEPLASEFRRCAQQLQMGLSMAATMKSLTARVRIAELRILSAALVIQRQTGGNLARALDRVAAVVRDRQNYRRQFRAGTAGGRMGMLLVGVCVPAYLAFILFFESDYGAAFFNQPLGWGLFAAASALLLTGLLWVMATLKTNY